MNRRVWNLFNSVGNVPTEVLQTLYKNYCSGVEFLTFINECDEAASKYGLDGDYLSSYIIDIYENTHPEVMK